MLLKENITTTNIHQKICNVGMCLPKIIVSQMLHVWNIYLDKCIMNLNQWKEPRWLHQNAPLMHVEVDVLTLEDTAWEVPPTPRRRKNEEGLRGLMNFTQGHMVTCFIKNKRVNEHKWGTTDGFQHIHDYLFVDVVETIGANRAVNDMTCINSSATSHTHHQTDCCLLLRDNFETGQPIWQ